MGKGGVIKINGSDVHVDERGTVSVDGTEVGALKLVTVSQPDSLKKMGNALFAGGSDEKEADGVKIRQGYIETSNVNAVRMMTEMIDLSRGYESYQKMIQSLDDAAKKSISDVGRLA